MDNKGIIGEILETGQSTVRKNVKQAASDFAKSAKVQITGSQNDQGTNEQANVAAQNQQKMSDDDAKKFLQDLYGRSDKNSAPDKSKTQGTQNPQNPISQSVGIVPKNPNEGKSPEELAKIEALRQQLHGDYYQNLTNRRKPEEEHVAEKLDREEQEEKFEDLEKEKKKPPKLPQTQKVGTGEFAVGVSG